MAVVIGTFRDYAQAQQVVRALIASGASTEAISVVGRREGESLADVAPDSRPVGEAASGTALGLGTGAVLGGALAAMGLAIPGLGPLVAAGPLTAALAGASVGAAAGGVIGVLVDLGVPDEEARRYVEAVRSGATLVTVTADDAVAERAVAVMKDEHALGIEEQEETGARVMLYGQGAA